MKTALLKLIAKNIGVTVGVLGAGVGVVAAEELLLKHIRSRRNDLDERTQEEVANNVVAIQREEEEAKKEEAH